jgi:hypothetical protein
MKSGGTICNVKRGEVRTRRSLRGFHLIIREKHDSIVMKKVSFVEIGGLYDEMCELP